MSVKDQLQQGTEVRKALPILFCSGLLGLSSLVIPFGLANDHHQQQNGAQKKLQYEVSVILKLVQVHVSDKNGNPVVDLNSSDFEIRDNGETRSITHFERHLLPRAEAGPLVEPSAGPTPQPTLSRKILFLFDFAFNDLAGIMKSKSAALAFLDTQAVPEDEFAVLSYRVGKGLILHEYLTSDTKEIRRVIEGFGAKEVLGRAAEVDSEYSQDQDKLSGALGVDTDIIRKTREADRRTYENQTGDMIASLSELAKALRYVPGTKNIVLFSAGIANFVLYGSEKFDTSFLNAYGNPALRERYLALGKELAASNCSIYAVNVRGLGTSHRKDRDLLGDLSLGQLAKDTGGKYFDNIAEHEAINREIQNLTGAYYVLGYYIDERWDGKFHRIEVFAKRRDCHVLGQTGYFNPKPFSEYSTNEKFFHLIDLALSDKSHLQEAIELPVLVLPYEIKTKVGFIILAKLPVKMLEGTGGAKAECVSLVFNNQNDVVAFLRNEIDRRPPPGVDAFISSSVWLSPGEYECRVVLRDMTTGKGARGSSHITAPEKSQSGMIVFPFLLLRPGTGSVVNEDGGLSGKVPEGARLADTYPFDQAVYCPIVGTVEKKTTRLFALVRCRVSGSTVPEIGFSSYARRAATAEDIPVPTRVVNARHQEGAHVYLLELTTGELAPGQWSLKIVAEMMDSHQKATLSRDFVVE